MIGRFLLAGSLLFSAFSLSAGEVRTVQLSQGATGTRAEIELVGKGEFHTLTLKGPDRLVVDLPASKAKAGLKLPAGTGIVRAVRTGQPNPETLRVVFDLAAPVVALKPQVETTASGSKLVIEWPGDGPVPVPAVAAAPPQASPPSAQSPQAAAAQTTAALASAVAQQAASTPAVQAPANGAGLSPQAILNGQSVPAQVPAAQAPAVQAPAVATVPPAAPSASGTGATSPAPATAPSSTSSVPLGDYLARRAAEEQAANATTHTPPPAVAAKPPAAEPQRPNVAMRAGMRPLVVAIDAGHGGQDPGAIGPNGKREKDVTLAVARELARQINATPGLKAVLTRDTDVFIPLNQRAVLARKAKADMFVSIHADAAENREARGSSVFVLSLRGATSQRARWLADKENAADLIGGISVAQASSTLASVLIDLTQSGQMKASEEAAGHILESLGKIGPKRRVEKANFAVLRTSDMPAMLVETGFISNPTEEALLASPDYQRKLAAAMLDGVQTYFTRQPPPGTLFAARAQAAQGAGSASGGAP